MINFNGGTGSLGTSLSPLPPHSVYLLMHSGNFWLAVCFLALTTIYFSIVLAMLCRYIINYRRSMHLT